MTLLLFSTAGYRGSHYDSGNSGMKILKKIKSFLLTTVQQIQPKLTLHCPKLVQNIKIRILCDVRVYTRKILRSSVFAQFGLFYGKLFQMTLLLFSTAGYRGSHYDSGNSGMKI